MVLKQDTNSLRRKQYVLRKMEINLRKMAFMDFAAQRIVLISRESILFAEARLLAVNYLKLIIFAFRRKRGVKRQYDNNENRDEDKMVRYVFRGYH